MPIRVKLAWDKSHDPTANSQNLEDMWITPDYNYYNQHGAAGLQLTGQHYSPNQQQYTVGHCFCKVWSFWLYECWQICTFIYLQPDGSDYHALAFGTNYGGGGLQLTGQHYSHHRQHTVGHLFFFAILIETEFEKVYSKASSYTASSNTGLADARFLIGSKTIRGTRIYVVKTLSCTFLNDLA